MDYKNLYKRTYKFAKRGLKKIARTVQADTKAIEEKVILSEEDRLALEQAKLDKTDLEEVLKWIGDTDKEHVWAFNSGHGGQDFRGNPKFLFAYVNNYRPDIKGYWICRDIETIANVRKAGYKAYRLGSPAASFLRRQTGVFVNEQVRGLVPFADDIKYLNLWHGHGFKASERARIEDTDDMRVNLATKYIKLNGLYMRNMILDVVNPLQEKYMSEYIGLPEENILRAGYARSTYQKQYKPIETFDHDILKRKGLPEGTKIVVYAPTFRAQRGNSFHDAFPELEKLYQCCEKNGYLLIFKMHPLMENESGFIAAKELYGERPYFFFWDNVEDIYEVMHKVDLLIYDYSSIFNDFLLAGVKNYIRYIYDGDDMVTAASINNEEEYYKYTYGTICKTYDELLEALDNVDEAYDEEKLNDILTQQWEYSDEDDFERTIQFTMDFKVKKGTFPTLYSFDIFDTVLSRKGLDPDSIFYAMKEKLRKTDLFEECFVVEFVRIRKGAETGLREYMNKTKEQRESIKTEITLKQIYDMIQEVHNLSDEQTAYLMNLEQELEIDSVIPLTKQINQIKELLANKEMVMLISDMYLPKDTIVKMLEKADPILTSLPFFLSNEYGVLKSNQLLFFEVYRSFKPFYNFEKWIHTGDNKHSDQNMPRKMCINTRLLDKPEYNEPEKKMSEFFDNYDGFKVAAMQARMRADYAFPRSEFVIDFVAPLFVSYVDWAVRDALERGIKTLYFVSRDGHPLKNIADALIEQNGWDIKTKYIYASRRVWRVPSYIDEVDTEYFADYGGNFNDIHSKDKFLHAAGVDSEEQLRELVPQMNLDMIDFEDWSQGQPARALAVILKNNKAYNEFILKKAAEQRGIVCEYLKQEVDPTEKHAFVEFWGRGYNQLCHSRLWNYTLGYEDPVRYYYARALVGTEGNCVRYRMTTTSMPMFFIETIFANMPYRSVEGYERKGDKIVPIITPIPYDKDLFNAMEKLLPEYARRYAALELSSPKGTSRRLFDFQMYYYEEFKQTPFIYENFGNLVDAVSLYGEKKQFAPPFTEEDVEEFANGVPRAEKTMSIVMSYERSPQSVKEKYNELFQLDPEELPSRPGYLSELELEENKDYKEKLEKEAKQADLFAKYYRGFCREKKVGNSVLIVTATQKPGDALYSLREALKGQSKYQVKEISMKKLEEDEFQSIAAEFAQAKYIYINGDLPILSGLEFRSETKCILINNSAIELHRKGADRIFKLKWKKKYRKFLYNLKCASADMPSDRSIKELADKYYWAEDFVDQIKGSAVTDVYFSKEYKEAAINKLYKKWPDIKGHKIILYLPDLRKGEFDENWYDVLSIRQIQQELGDEYKIIIDTRNHKDLLKKMQNNMVVPGMSMIINSGISLRELMVVADVIIGDYRDSLYEAVLLHKPVYFTAYDEDRVAKDINLKYDLTTINPFPKVHHSKELAELLKNVEAYDYAPLEAFKEEYLTYCDGKTAERIMKYMES